MAPKGFEVQIGLFVLFTLLAIPVVVILKAPGAVLLVAFAYTIFYLLDRSAIDESVEKKVNIVIIYAIGLCICPPYLAWKLLEIPLQNAIIMGVFVGFLFTFPPLYGRYVST